MRHARAQWFYFDGDRVVPLSDEFFTLVDPPTESAVGEHVSAELAEAITQEMGATASCAQLSGAARPRAPGQGCRQRRGESSYEPG